MVDTNGGLQAVVDMSGGHEWWTQTVDMNGRHKGVYH